MWKNHGDWKRLTCVCNARYYPCRGGGLTRCQPGEHSGNIFSASDHNAPWPRWRCRAQYLRYRRDFCNKHWKGVAKCVMWKSKAYVDLWVLGGTGNSALFSALYGWIWLLNRRVGRGVVFILSQWAFDILMGRMCRVLCEKIRAIESV